MRQANSCPTPRKFFAEFLEVPRLQPRCSHASSQSSPIVLIHAGRSTASNETPVSATAAIALLLICAAKGCVASIKRAMFSRRRYSARPMMPPNPPVRTGRGLTAGLECGRQATASSRFRACSPIARRAVPLRSCLRAAEFAMVFRSSPSWCEPHAMSDRWLSIIGIGEDGRAGLSAAANTLIDAADLVVGGRRHLDLIGSDPRHANAVVKPLDATIPEILARRGTARRRAVSGDPLLVRRWRDARPFHPCRGDARRAGAVKFLARRGSARMGVAGHDDPRPQHARTDAAVAPSPPSWLPHPRAGAQRRNAARGRGSLGG